MSTIPTHKKQVLINRCCSEEGKTLDNKLCSHGNQFSFINIDWPNSKHTAVSVLEITAISITKEAVLQC